MINGVHVENYKSLKEVDVELGNFTPIVGSNNSGKTALLEAIMYLKTASDSNVGFGEQMGGAPYLDHSLEPDVVNHRSGERQADSISLSQLVDVSDRHEYEELEQLYRDLNPSVSCPSSIWIGAEIARNYWVPIVESEDHSEILSILDKSRSESEIFVEHEVLSGENRLYDNGVWRIGFRSGKPDMEDLIEKYQSIILDSLEDIYYITDNRDISDWQSDPQQQDFVGHFGENTVSMLHALRDQPEIFNRIVDAISEIAPDVVDLRADMFGANTQTELQDADTKELFNVVASGAGLRRLLPIIVQIGAANSGDTILIEEPEISVYPETQERLVEFMLESTRERDIQIVFTTHGYALTWKIQNMSNPDDGHCLVFNKEDGESIVEQTSLDRIPVEQYYGDE